VNLRRPARLRITGRTRQRLVRGLVVGGVAALALLALRGTQPVERAEAALYDARSRLATRLVAPAASIAIIAIDDNSLEVQAEALGRWPWPRDAHAALVEYLMAAGARLVVFDVTFPEPDRADPEGDLLFQEAMAASGLVVLPTTFSPGSEAAAAEWAAARGERWAEARDALAAHVVGAAPEPPPADLRFAYAEPPMPTFARAARSVGGIVFGADPDGVVRRERLVYAYQGSLYPSLALAAARAAAPERFGGAVTIGADTLVSGAERVPLDRGRLPIRWRGRYLAGGRSTYPIYPAFHVLSSYNQVATGVDPDVPLEAFRDRVVFIGVTALGAHDLRATPLAPHDPGVLIHATILDNLLQGDYLRRAPAWAHAGGVVATGLAVALPVALLPSVLAGALAGLLVLLLAVVGASAAFAAGVWLDLAAPLAAGLVAFAGSLGAGYLVEGREKRRVRELFGRYVTPAYVERLAERPETLRLGGERVPLTVLFSDIRGFTSLSERLPADAVIHLLNQYLDAMAEVVFRHEGTIDKFIGDAVMAFWGAPVPVADHARRAVEAALDMTTELDRLNARWSEDGSSPPLRIGIGIHTGEAVVGNIGSLSRKLDYTAIGDTVNLASRLEGLNKEQGTTILVSEATARAAGTGYEFHDLGEVSVKGKAAVVAIHELRGRADAAGAAPAGLAPVGSGGGHTPARVVTGMLLAASLLLAAAPASAQGAAEGRMQWTAWLYQPGRWQGDRLERLPTRDAETSALALAGVVELYSAPPRWRAEIRRVAAGDLVEEPVVLVHTGDEVRVLTAVGSTALVDHRVAQEALTGVVLGLFDARGRPATPDRERLVRRLDNEEVEWIAIRRPVARPAVPDHLFATGRVGTLGRRAARFGIHAIGGERSEEVVASAGARGVARVRTVDGEITIHPDTVAARRLAAIQVRVMDLEQFMRSAGLGPFAAQPDSAPRKEEEG
jgi:adenylate cyclase